MLWPSPIYTLSTPTNNKVMARRFLEECWTKPDLELVGELVASNISMSNIPFFYPEGIHGTKEIRDHLTGVRALVPDLRVQVKDLIAENDKVVAFWTASGTHLGHLGGPYEQIPPTNEAISWSGVYIYRFESGKIVDIVIVEDGLNLLHQIKALDTWKVQN